MVCEKQMGLRPQRVLRVRNISRLVLQLLQMSNRAPAFDRRHAKLSSCALSDTIVCATSQGAPLSVCIGFLYAYLLTSQKDCIVPLMPVNMCARTVDVAMRPRRVCVAGIERAYSPHCWHDITCEKEHL